MTTYSKLTAMAGAICILSASFSVNADPVDRYVSLDVQNPDAFVLALDRFQNSEVQDGATVSLWGVLFNGSSDASHVVVLEYDDYAEMQSIDEKSGESREWMEFLNAIEGTSDVVSLSMGVQRISRGSGWHEHGAAMVFVMTVNDPGAYAPEFEKLVDEMENPGSIRLIEMRAGGEGTTHLAVITAPDFVSLNEYLDELLSSRAYADFVDEVGDIRRINTTSMYRRLQTWGI